MKKKYFAWIALLLMMCVVTGCGNSKTGQSTNIKVDDPDYYDNVPPTGMGFDLSNEDVFETGYYHVMFDTFSSAVIYFESNNEQDSDIEWAVYITDHELNDEEIDELLNQEPIAINEGSADINAEQWIYVFCNINSKTSASPTNSTFKLYSLRDYA